MPEATIDDTLRHLEEGQLPEIPVTEVGGFLLDRFGFVGEFTPLKSEFDQMYRCEVRPHEEYIIRISGSLDGEALDFQRAVLATIAKSDPGLPIPRLVPSRLGNTVEYILSNTSTNAVRVFTCLNGIPVRDTGKSSIQLELLGKTLARLDKALSTVTHSSQGNTRLWDLRRATSLRPLVDLAQSTSKRRLLNSVLDEADSIVNPRMSSLRQQVIHADYNGKNVLVNPQNPSQVAGIIDFGDAVRTALVAEISFAICRYSLEDAARMLGAYHSINPLSRTEIETIYHIVCTRLCMASLVQTWRSSRGDPRSQNMDMASDELTGSLDAIRSIGALRVTQFYLEACQLSAGRK